MTAWTYYLLLEKLHKPPENDVSRENVTHKSFKSELKLTRTHSSDTFNKQKKIAQGFDWLNLLTKLVKDYEKYLEMAKTNCLKHRVDKQVGYIEERENLMFLVMRLLVQSTRMLLILIRVKETYGVSFNKYNIKDINNKLYYIVICCHPAYTRPGLLSQWEGLDCSSHVGPMQVMNFTHFI